MIVRMSGVYNTLPSETVNKLVLSAISQQQQQFYVLLQRDKQVKLMMTFLHDVPRNYGFATNWELCVSRWFVSASGISQKCLHVLCASSKQEDN